MDQQTLKHIATQLRKPQGEAATQVGEKMNDGNRHINLRAIRRLEVKPGDNILEIGMGNGFFVSSIVSVAPNVRYTGCDYSPEMVQQATVRNQAAVASGQARFLAAEAGSLAFPEGVFDKIFTVNTFYFWENPAEVLAEVYRLLKPAGTLLIGLRPKATMQHYPFVSYGFRLYDAGDITPLLSAAGFGLVSTEEEREPDQEFNGRLQRVDGLLVVARKPG